MDPFHSTGSRSGSVSDYPDPDPGPGVKFLRNCSFASKILTNAKMKMLISSNVQCKGTSRDKD